MSSLAFRLGIIGAGQMGTGIALTAARAKLPVQLCDFPGQVAKSSDFIRKWTDKEVKKRPEVADVPSRISLQSDLAALKSCDVVIECISERLDAKLELVRKLSDLLKTDTLVATNTSSFSVTQLAAAYKTPTQFVGMHFFNPVPMMQLVEVIPALQTAPTTLQRAKDLAAVLGKKATEVHDRPCFVVNRVLIVMINEAIHALADGVGTPEAIDTTCKLGLGHPMGPLQLADFVGLDTCLEVIKSLHRGLGDDKYRPSPLLARYVEAGWFGRKSGRGFYVYST